MNGWPPRVNVRLDEKQNVAWFGIDRAGPARRFEERPPLPRWKRALYRIGIKVETLGRRIQALAD